MTSRRSTLSLTGGTLTGALTLAADPVGSMQAATKKYVDNQVATALPKSGGTLSGALSLAADPTTSLQAATKQYVDGQVATAVPKAGGALSGPLTLAADPAGLLQAATKQYVDGQIATAVPRAGGVLSGPLTLAADPTASLQAATKQYVDTRVSRTGDTLTGPLVLAGDPPRAAGATKQYVDTRVSRTGDTLTGPLVLAGDPAVSLQAATKHYVDIQLAGSLPISGGTLTGALTLAVQSERGPASCDKTVRRQPDHHHRADRRWNTDWSADFGGRSDIVVAGGHQTLRGCRRRHHRCDQREGVPLQCEDQRDDRRYCCVQGRIPGSPRRIGDLRTERRHSPAESEQLGHIADKAGEMDRRRHFIARWDATRKCNSGRRWAGQQFPAGPRGRQQCAERRDLAELALNLRDFAVQHSSYIVNHTGGPTGGAVSTNSRNETIIYNSPNNYVWGGLDRLLWCGVQSQASNLAQHVARYVQTIRQNIGTDSAGRPLPQPELWAACLEYRDTTGQPSSWASASLTVEMDWIGNGPDDGNARQIQSLVIGQHNTAGTPVEVSTVVGIYLAGGSTGHVYRVFGVNVPFSTAVLDTTNAQQLPGAAAIRMAAGHAIAFEPSATCRLSYDSATNTLRWNQGTQSYAVGKGITVGWLNVYSSNATLANYVSGNMILLVGSGSPYTITLPAASSVAAGTGFTFSVLGTAAVTIATTGGDTIDNGPITLRPNDRYHIVSDADIDLARGLPDQRRQSTLLGSADPTLLHRCRTSRVTRCRSKGVRQQWSEAQRRRGRRFRCRSLL